MAHPPTPEQSKILEAFRSGGDMVVNAGAGTGKTSTSVMLAESTRRRGLYVAYNKSIATEAKAKFPRWVACSTAHSLAYRTIGYQYKDRLKAPRVPAWRTAQALGVDAPVKLGDVYLDPSKIAQITMETVDKYTHSADAEIRERHVAIKPGIDTPEQRRELRALIVPLARKAWEDLTRFDGELRFTHDCYLKIWALSRPVLPVDFLLVDEAQDLNPALGGIIECQQGGSQIVAVGDANQAIYGWRGATDFLSRLSVENRLNLSQSFRFGPEVAEEANKWLSLLGADLRLSGFNRINSQVGPLGGVDAILCRTNGQAIAEAIAEMDDGNRVAIVGGGQEIRRLAEAAVSLKAGVGTSHPELMAFSNWAEVQDYAEQDPDGSDLAVTVRLIDAYGPERILQIVRRLVDERNAQVVISTAHKAKGREWANVRIAGDFRKPRMVEGQIVFPAREELMLSYVAVTRARLGLDPGGLSWISDYM